MVFVVARSGKEGQGTLVESGLVAEVVRGLALPEGAVGVSDQVFELLSCHLLRVELLLFGVYGLHDIIRVIIRWKSFLGVSLKDRLIDSLETG